MLRHLPPVPARRRLSSTPGVQPFMDSGRQYSDQGRCRFRSTIEFERSPSEYHILVVHDQPEIISMISEMFRKVGYRYITTGNSTQAVKAIEQKSFDLLFTELEMPLLDGHSLACLYKKYHPQAKALVMTCRCQAELVDLIKEGTVDGWLYKPFNICALNDILIGIGLGSEATPVQHHAKAENHDGKV